MNAGHQAIVTAPRYDRFSMALHWLTALLAVTLFLLAEFWDYAPRPTRHLLVTAHMSLGIILAAVLLTRIFWRATPGHKIPDAATGLEELAAKTVHYLLYILLAAQVGLGFALRWTENHPLSFFGLPIPSPFGTFSKATSDLVDRLHVINAWTIIVLAGGHALFALVHHFVLRDDVLRRMLPGD